jgi:hypothetical protein
MFKLLLQNFIKANGRSPNAIEMLQLKFKAASQANRGQILPFKQKRDFAAEIKAMMDDGTIKVGQVDKKNDNVLQRELFKNSNLNNPEPVTIKSGVSNSQLNKNKAIDQGIKVEPVNEKFIQFTIQDIKKKEPIEGMKIANQIIKREGDFVDLTEEQSKKILTEVNDHIMGVDLPIGPEDLAKGGRAGFYTGGITDVEPSLDDIGHGSDSLMARTRLVSPGSQATTSTGLNYLLAEDNDNIRVPFSAGGGGRRAFLKLMATLGGGIAGLKSGLIGLGEGGAKKAITETVKQSTGSGYPPPYFFRLVEKIKFMGDDTLASQDKAIAKKYKDYIMEEEYEEFTATPDGDGKMKNIEQGVPDEIIEEAGDTTAMTLKKADGGRIGFRVGGSGKKFIEKIFGKGSLDAMKGRDPEMYQGMLEVVDMFRKRDKEGLKIYMQKFLPHMDDETVEAFIRGDAEDAAGLGKYGLDNIQGQLIRLSSGRDYAGKIEALNRLERNRALKNLDVTDNMKRKPNANGGLITMLGE